MRRSARTAAAAALARANATASAAADPAAAAAKSRGAKRSASAVAASPDPAAHVRVKAELPSNENSHGNAVVKHERAAGAPVKAEKTESAGEEALQWRKLCSAQELSCKLTLASGQVFSWRYHAHACEWSGVVGNHVFALRESNAIVEFRCVHPLQLPSQEAHAILTHYFRLETEATPLYEAWTTLDDPMAQLIRSLPGHRMIRQDPVECLFSFICSSNNNIQRIQQMVDKLRATYGTHLCTVDAASLALMPPDSKLDPRKGEPDAAVAISYYSFPSPDTLAAKCEEATLRALGFGYRAPFITKSSRQLMALGGVEYLLKLRDWKPQANADVNALDETDEYQAKLMVFAGVGRKVADCIALFALERLDAIPVDTHVWQIACREFDPSLEAKKSTTPSVYKSVGDHFRRRFSPCAGWAHSVLFTGDLTAFQSHLPTAMQKPKKKKTQVKKKAAGKASARGSKAT